LLDEDIDDSPLCVRRLSDLVMKEADFKRKIYDLVLLVLLLYVALVFPWLLSFTHFRMRIPGEECIEHDAGTFLNVVDAVVTVFFWFDLVLSFFFSYNDREGIEVTDFVKIAKRYLSGAFWVNLIACVPSQVMQPLVELLPIDPGGCASSTGLAGAHQATRLARLQRITRLARLARLVRVVRLSQVLHKWAATLHMIRSFRLANMVFLLLWLILMAAATFRTQNFSHSTSSSLCKHGCMHLIDVYVFTSCHLYCRRPRDFHSKIGMCQCPFVVHSVFEQAVNIM
jgi:hypothetical protein